MANPLLPYNLVATVKRRIPKFNVEGTQYTLSIPAIQQNDLPFNIVNAMVHDVFARKYVLSCVWFWFFFPINFLKYAFSPLPEGILRELLYENDAPRYPNHH